MKITNYVIVFCLVAMTVFLGNNLRIRELDKVTEEIKQYNQDLDTALDAAVDSVVEVSDGELHLDKDESVELFMNSLYASFGLSDDDTLQEAFNVYVPVIAIADVDGLYVHFNNYAKNKVAGVWTTGFPYVYREGDFSINYHLDDSVIVTDTTTGKKYAFQIGKMQDEITQVNYPQDWNRANRILSLKCLGKDYYDYKAYAVTECLTEHLSYYANLNNELAQAFGISYTFALPESAVSDMGRAVNDVTFMALFQGYPIGIGDHVYSKFAIAGTRILKKSTYHLGTINGVLYYHRTECKKGVFNDIITYASKAACARAGALPCPYCKP